MQPASETKHIQELAYEFHGQTFLLNQRDDHGITNGTTLWLGGQVLSYYLAFILETKANAGNSRKIAIELGSGIGLTAYVLM
jgi:protein N-lysine methyltransferase METTL21D